MTSTLIRSSQLNTPLNAPTIHRLANGLTIIAEQIPVDAVNLNVWLDVGSSVESDAINGMAHFLEHMVFKGTDRLQSGEFEKQIEQRGAVTNAATSQDYTHYYITTAPKDFATLAPLQLDVVLNARIPEDGFERERFVVLEEIRRSQDNPRRRTYQHLSEMAFETLPYRRQVLGPTSVIENLSAEQMRDFHAGWYHPRSMTAVAVGNLPVEQLIRIVEQSVSDISPAVSKPERDVQRSLRLTAEQPFPEIVRQEHLDPSLTQARLMMLWRVPGLTDLEQTYALDGLASILGHGRTARLVKDLREERGLVSSVSVSNMTYRHQGIFTVSAQLPSENIDAVEAAIVAHMQAMQSELVTKVELDRVRTQVANHFTFGNETPSDRSGLYGYYQTLVGDLKPAFHYPTAIQALSAEDLQQAAQTYLPTQAYGCVVVKPGK